jgi:hypothetical protein
LPEAKHQQAIGLSSSPRRKHAEQAYSTYPATRNQWRRRRDYLLQNADELRILSLRYPLWSVHLRWPLSIVCEFMRGMRIDQWHLARQNYAVSLTGFAVMTDTNASVVVELTSSRSKGHLSSR